MSAIRTVNIEVGMPTLEEARQQVLAAIRQARRDGVRVLKVIHGYGSTGKGGKLNMGLRKSFRLRKREGLIHNYIPGEKFSIFEEQTLRLLEAVPELRGDRDLNVANDGITLLWLK